MPRQRYISRKSLILAVEDYIEDKKIDDREASRLKELARRDGWVFVSSGDLTEKMKPYLLAFVRK